MTLIDAAAAYRDACKAANAMNQRIAAAKAEAFRLQAEGQELERAKNRAWETLGEVAGGDYFDEEQRVLVRAE